MPLLDGHVTPVVTVTEEGVEEEVAALVCETTEVVEVVVVVEAAALSTAAQTALFETGWLSWLFT